MPVTVANTPNPNALKFTVGTEVGGPATFVAGKDTDDPLASQLLALDGVASVFLTADFVTISKMPGADWDALAPAAVDILESHFG
jgi:hypothetical protein